MFLVYMYVYTIKTGNSYKIFTLFRKRVKTSINVSL